MPSNVCIFEYLYRDAGNWKTYGRLLLSGQHDAAHAVAIRKSLDSGLLFVPEQVGIPPLQRQHLTLHGAGDADDFDHAFHEFMAIRAAGADEVENAVQTESLQELAVRFEHASRAGWNVRLSPFGHW